MRIDRRTGLMALAGLAAPGRLRAQPGWPSRPVRIVVPFGLGGSADIAARFLADPLSVALGQPVVVENRPGAGAVIGTDTVAKSAPDGHTLLLMSNTHTANETLLPARPYVLMRDLAPVAAINTAVHVLAVHGSLGVRTVAELIAKARAAPGTLDYASSGPGTPYHIASEVFAAMAGIRLNHIPFRGSNEARTALIAGQVPIMFDAIPTMREQITNGRVLGLATTGTARSPLLADLPAVAETLPGFEAAIWLGLMAPAGLPAPIAERLHAEIGKLLASGPARETMARNGAEPMPMSIAEFDAFLRGDIERQQEWIRMAKIQMR
ncbi:Bug family tripartite tricarboxylate transporter substrate binding protein [Belnapia rosea]|uniref:Tripartite-type tricarboxylate transporter, receptor component TctC n=1 Tax=Belnapia rosea TaxID=938405 RepID=A0A1G6LL14_9PROT|nr:tripartite tricarboxylate transporter substrate binding protein [Belnapia rosea]SDC43940.1 Tripartite-type tricarboxylate transporter, receptor component TctC [Belnapia rosea]